MTNTVRRIFIKLCIVYFDLSSKYAIAHFFNIDDRKMIATEMLVVPTTHLQLSYELHDLLKSEFPMLSKGDSDKTKYVNIMVILSPVLY